MPAAIAAAVGATAAGIGPQSTIPKKRIKLNYGESTAHFGHQDYKGNRLAGFSNEDILKYLDANPHTLQGRNVAGNSSGVYERVAGRGTPGTYWGKRGDMFGHADLAGARKQGWSDQEIRNYLDQNAGVLQKHNVPGGGRGPGGRLGVYDSLSDRSGWWNDLPAPPPPAPSTQLGTASLESGHTATGLVSPTAEGANMNTGGTAQAFARDKRLREVAHALSITGLTL
jgi:hypothetical protein